jgi:filamentous hemagglutinin
VGIAHPTTVDVLKGLITIPVGFGKWIWDQTVGNDEGNSDSDDVWSEPDEINDPSTDISPEAKAIRDGHGYKKHRNEFPEIKDEEDFGRMIDGVINNPSESKENLNDGRKAYWDDETGTLVIVDPGDADGGTVFRPEKGKDLFDELK